jgi:hypothetical protein
LGISSSILTGPTGGISPQDHIDTYRAGDPDWHFSGNPVCDLADKFSNLRIVIIWYKNFVSNRGSPKD